MGLNTLERTLWWLLGFRYMREPGLVRVHVPGWVPESVLVNALRRLDAESPGRWLRYGRTLICSSNPRP